jgi:hypothetical protein
MPGLFLGLGLSLYPSRAGGEAAFDSRTAMPAGSTYTRTGTATGQTVAGLISLFAANAPQRTDRGLALEPARTNLAVRSEAFDNASWSKSSVTATADQVVAPDGTTTADRVQINAGARGNNTIQQLVDLGGATSANKVVSISVWLRSLSGTQNLSLKSTQSAVVDNFSNITVTTTWTRYTFTVTNTASAGNGLQNVGLSNHSDASAVDIYAWGFQAEIGTPASSYIPTVAATVARSLPVFTEPVPTGKTKALLTCADASTTLVTGLTPGGTFDYVTPILAANKGRFGASELVSREWQA